jgi:hypothetical protein
MSKIVLIECAAKQNRAADRCRAKDLYTSPLFRKSLEYAQVLQPDKIFILSSKYGLLGLDQDVSPYDVDLNHLPARKRRELAERILTDLRKVSDLNHDQFIILAGERAIQYLIGHITNHEIPMRGLVRGKKLHWLNERLNKL